MSAWQKATWLPELQELRLPWLADLQAKHAELVSTYERAIEARDVEPGQVADDRVSAAFEALVTHVEHADNEVRSRVPEIDAAIGEAKERFAERQWDMALRDAIERDSLALQRVILPRERPLNEIARLRGEPEIYA